MKDAANKDEIEGLRGYAEVHNMHENYVQNKNILS